jgi:hypothetical protein
VTAEEIAEMVHSAYGLFARSSYDGIGDRLVNHELVPEHAAGEVDAAAREMFSSMTV